MTKHFLLRFGLPAMILCSALSACVIRTSGTYDDCEVDPQYCSGTFACFIDRDCPSGLICDRGNSICVPTSTCFAGQTCARYYHCDERATCVPDDWTGSMGGRGGAGHGGAGGTGSGGRTGSGGNGSGGASTGGAPGSGGVPATGGHGTGGAPGPAGTGGAAGAGPSCAPA